MAQTRYYLINVSFHQLILFQRIVYFEERRERHQKGYKHNLKRFLLNLEAFQKKNLFYLYVNFELSKQQESIYKVNTVDTCHLRYCLWNIISS